MSIQLQTAVGSVIVLALVLALIVARERLGSLNAASWLVVVGAVVIAGEHAQFAISFSLPGSPVAPLLVSAPHARLHFFMAGVYAFLGLGALCVLARTLLREGRPVAWFLLLVTLLVGLWADLVVGGFWFQHGSPLYALLGIRGQGFGWEFLYLYPVAWAAALVLSYRPIFGTRAALPAGSPTAP